MKTYISLLSSLLFCSLLSAQVGLVGGFKTLSADNWEAAMGSDLLPSNGYSIGIDYWFKLKKKRVEFTPELSWSKFSNSRTLNEVTENADLSIIGFHFNTNIYPLDFGNDCNCPTFKKDGGLLDKGFFIQVSPGIDFINATYGSSVIDGESTSNNSAFNIGIGAGIDIGLLPIVTITPIVSYRYYFSTSWDGLAAIFPPTEPISTNNDIEDHPNQLFVGLKLGVRFDELGNYGWRR